MRFGLLFLLLGFAPLLAQNSQIAGMQQDLAELRNEVEKLKLENADLREALVKQRNATAGNSTSSEASARTKAEALAEVDRRLKQQTADVNAALAELARRVDAALAGRQPPTTRPTTPPTKAAGTSPSATPPATTPPAANPPAAPDDGLAAEIPRTGTPYKVKPGDTVTRIARQFGSKVEWILQANKLSSPSALRADVEIFVPQPEAPAR
jgi:LysM repeat protein